MFMRLNNLASSASLANQLVKSLSQVPRLSKLSNPLNMLSISSNQLPSSLVRVAPSQKSLVLGLREAVQSSLSDALSDVIYQLKRTFQPSLIRRKRKHGFLARKNSRHGLKIIHRRLEKGRRALCA